MTSLSALKKDLLSGDRRALAKAITLIESQKADDRILAESLIDEILRSSGKSLRIGISGSPGVGKSTFIESFGQKVLANFKKVAVLAVDPSSPISGGSILGDKTRMEILSQNQNVFIRPSPSSGNLGGVAQKTRESLLLCEAAGYDFLIIETVGVGQSEVEVASMVDVFVVLIQPNAGDDLQGIKKGIVELADFLIITKADGSHLQAAERSHRDYQAAMHLVRGVESEKRVLSCSALENKGIAEVLGALLEFCEKNKFSGDFSSRREKQDLKWFERRVTDGFFETLHNDPALKAKWSELEQKILKKTMSPQSAARHFLERALFRSPKIP